MSKEPKAINGYWSFTTLARKFGTTDRNILSLCRANKIPFEEGVANKRKADGRVVDVTFRRLSVETLYKYDRIFKTDIDQTRRNVIWVRGT